jgi:hypothetical protein
MKICITKFSLTTFYTFWIRLVQARTLPKPESFDLFLWGIYCDAITESNIHPVQGVDKEMSLVVTAINGEVRDTVLNSLQKLQLTILVLKGAHIKMLLHKLPSPSDKKYSNVHSCNSENIYK